MAERGPRKDALMPGETGVDRGQEAESGQVLIQPEREMSFRPKG